MSLDDPGVASNIMLFSIRMVWSYISQNDIMYKDMGQLVYDARDMVTNNHPFILIMKKSEGSTKIGHAVGVYKIMENRTAREVIFSVYDCNHPDGKPRFARVALQDNTFN